MIESLDTNQIFVFGSNLVGNHAGGAALQAKEKFGAIEGRGEGMQGQSYAFPTLDKRMNRRIKLELEHSRFLLYICCAENLSKEFLLTKVGCGIAGFDEKFIKSLFADHPKNLVLPEDWN
jgi:hypothetical protein